MARSGAAGHVPERTCVGCRRVRPGPELVRVAVDDRGRGTLDPRNQLPGRGAYLCADGSDCLEQARRRRALTRSLRVGEDVINYTDLSATLEELRKEDPPSPR